VSDDKTGGVAFPPAYNLTVRDYFAAKAMQGIIATFDDDTTAMPEQVACLCYKIADAMLAARKEDK
jgi:hypothetical protein